MAGYLGVAESMGHAEKKCCNLTEMLIMPQSRNNNEVPVLLSVVVIFILIQLKFVH